MEQSSAVITVVATIVTGILVALATAYFTSRFYIHQARADLHREFQGRFNERRWEVYSEYSALLFQVMQSASDNRLDKELPKITKGLRELITKLWLVGSDEVVRAFLGWRQATPGDSSPGSGVTALLALVNILIAMRRDLGDTDTDITTRELLATFVNDIDKYLPPPSIVRAG